MKQKTIIGVFVVTLMVVGSLLALIIWHDSARKRPQSEVPVPQDIPETKPSENRNIPPLEVIADDEQDQTVKSPNDDLSKKIADPSHVQLRTAADLIQALMGILEGNGRLSVENLVERSIMERSVAREFDETLSKGPVALNPGTPVTEVGGAQDHTRYIFNFPNGARGTVDLVRGEDRKWKVASASLPTAEELASGISVSMHDPLGVAYDFVRASLDSDDKRLREMSDPITVSDATIAGLCILFEDGEYQLREKMPVRGMFSNVDNAGFLIYLTDTSGKNAGNMGLTMKKNPEGRWIVNEVSLDSLLADYASRYSDDEMVYFPLVKNPKGGDSIALFFGFNQDTLTPRSVRQLEIVAHVIMSGKDKKLEISGHTDDVGGEKYNYELSERRAMAVKKVLVDNGVPPERITTKGLGKSQPRRTYTSDMDSQAIDRVRSQNRRAEMYLDFTD